MKSMERIPPNVTAHGHGDRNAKSEAKPKKLFDGEGLYLLVNPSGVRLWRMKYRVHGREKLLSFGQYPEVSLKLARERRDEAKRLLAADIDPAESAGQRSRHYLIPSRQSHANSWR